MMRRTRDLVLPLYLLLCLVLGGSAQGNWTNMALQLMAIGIITWTAIGSDRQKSADVSKIIAVVGGIAGILIVSQLLPLPPAVWTNLPGRELLIQGYATLGYQLPWLPVSLTPFETVAAALSLLPPTAIFLAILRTSQKESWLVASLLFGTIVGIFVGALQVAGGGPGQSWWYFYPITNEGAVGFFANRNHMGTLLLVSIPFATAVMVSSASRARQHTMAIAAAGTGILLVLITGLALNWSLAALSLAIPVVFFSALMLPPGWSVRRFVFPAGALAFIGCVIFLTSSPIARELGGQDLSSFQSRSEIWSRTADLVYQYFPAGSGLGSFESVYPLAEDPSAVRSTFVNHAHNDYLEVLLELGAAGLILILVFLAWWGVLIAQVWRSTISSQYARAATIASGALLAHSFVDYPLRTGAISAVLGMCLALMSQSRQQQKGFDGTDLRPTKHLRIS